jgi:hypothetical protein
MGGMSFPQPDREGALSRYRMKRATDPLSHIFKRPQIDFVEMPSRMRLGSAFAQVRCDLWAKMVHPAPNSFVGDHDAAFRQQILDVAKARPVG